MTDFNLRVLHEHMLRVWRRIKPMPEEWKFGYVVPLPIKGDRTICKKWRGILLLTVPGKPFARVIAARLYKHCEEHQILPEWQCGFRSQRSTMDMIFTVRMILGSKPQQAPNFLALS